MNNHEFLRPIRPKCAESRSANGPVGAPVPHPLRDGPETVVFARATVLAFPGLS